MWTTSAQDIGSMLWVRKSRNDILRPEAAITFVRLKMIVSLLPDQHV